MASHEKKTMYNIRAVSNAIDLLEQFRGDMDELGLADLSRSLQLPKDNVFRLLATLQSHNYLEQNPDTGKYRLGFSTLALSNSYIRQLIPLEISRSVMESLVRECNETACMTSLRDFYIANLGFVECNQPLRFMPRVGMQLPAYCTAGGKSQIAFLEEESLRKHVFECQFQQLTPYTITDPQKLKSQLQEIAQQGYALQLEELEMGVRGVAVPIRDYTSRVVGAISLLGPSSRFSDERIKGEIVPLATKGAKEISDKLGYLPS